MQSPARSLNGRLSDVIYPTSPFEKSGLWRVALPHARRIAFSDPNPVNDKPKMVKKCSSAIRRGRHPHFKKEINVEFNWKQKSKLPPLSTLDHLKILL